MDKKKDDILTKAFKERLGDYKLPVSEDVWKKIEQDLPPVPKMNKRPLWLRVGVAATAAIAILAGLNWYFFYPQIDIEKEVISQVVEKQPIQEIPVVEILEEIPSEKIKQLAFGRPKKKTINNAPQSETVQIIKEQVAEANNVSEGQQNKTEKIKEQTVSNPNYQKPNLWTNSRKQKANNNLSFALAYVGPGTALSSNANSDPISRYSDTFSAVRTVNSSDLPDNPVISDVKYKIPITVGLSIRKHLTPDWALESGLTYTRLESTEMLIRLNGDNSTKNVQLNYIGIPLKVVYSFYTNNRFSLYTSAGGMVEKNVYGKEKLSTNRSATRLKMPELQWSLSGNVGLNYKLTNHFNLFAEPGIGYYFDDKSGIETIRKDKPWNLGIQVGIRLDLK